MCLPCGGRGTINSCALRNCRISERASWTCARLANWRWRPLPVSSEEGAASTGRRGLVLRIVASSAALALWFWTQSLIGARAPSAEIGDALQNWFGGLNSYFGPHPSPADPLLIAPLRFIVPFGFFCAPPRFFLTRLRP